MEYAAMKTSDIHIRDPFILPWEGRYYLYGTRGPTCWGKADGFDVYVSTDLQNWSAPIEIFHNDGTFWADQNYWAPEVHFYKGSFYLFATFFSENDAVARKFFDPIALRVPLFLSVMDLLRPKIGNVWTVRFL